MIDPERRGRPCRFGTWMRRYGGDRNVIGRPLTLNGQP
jgi:hypothetical protein